MISFIVPALNEENNIAATIETIVSCTKMSGIPQIQIIAVNDGSTDGTGAALEKLRGRYRELEVITHPVNQGLAACFRDGLQAVRYERFMIVPGDNDMDANFLLMMLRFHDSAELVMSFPVNSENRSLLRNVLSYAFRIFYMVGFHIHVNYINGPCCYPTDKVRRLSLRSQGFSIIAEVGTKLLRTGVTFCEIPGYFQTGSRPRKMLSLKNFVAVFRAFLVLFVEIHLKNPDTFKNTPRRVFVNFIEPPSAIARAVGN